MDDSSSKSFVVRINRSTIILAVIGIVAVLGSFLYWNHRVAAHNARVAAAQAEYNKYDTAMKKVAESVKKTHSVGKEFDAAYDKAQVASQKRHDGAVNGTASNDELLSYAKTESDGVDTMTTLLSDLESSFSDRIGIYASVYGDDAAKSASNDAMEWSQTSRQSLSYWSRAIGSIKDSLQASVNGSDISDDSSDELDNLFEQSDQLMEKARTLGLKLDTDLKKLRTRLDADVSRSKAALKAAQGS